MVLTVFPALADGLRPSPALSGMLGLNTVPSARMDNPGTLRFGAATLGPHLNGYIGFQIAEPLYISVRQTGESSSLLDDPDRLYPGIDVKLRLMKESAHLPAIAVGLNSAVGHKRTAGEYLSFSKRWNDFDFTAGIGWGRMGSAGHIPNPLKSLLGHFDKERDWDGNTPNGASDWFTGEKAGLFGGVEYFMPWEGVSMKADWNADRYRAEKTAMNISTPSPWSISLNYAPKNWLDLSLGMAGADTVMAHVSLQGGIRNWLGNPYKETTLPRFASHRTDIAQPEAMEAAARQDGLHLQNARIDGKTASALLILDPNRPTAMQIGRAARYMANHAGQWVESLSVVPSLNGLKGPNVTLSRRDLELALNHKSASPAELWRNTTLEKQSVRLSEIRETMPHRWLGFLDNDFSLSEEESGLLYRTSLELAHYKPLRYGFLYGESLRITLSHNLNNIRDTYTLPSQPVRSDIDYFSDRGASLDRAFLSWIKSLNTDWHLQITSGLLEEMYAGTGGEILYRPPGKTYAFGADIWSAVKRDPSTSLNLGLTGDPILSGFAKGWYEFPGTDLTFHVRAGRYLGEDLGVGFSLSKDFENGATLEGFLNASDQADPDLFGGTTHFYSGMRLTLPLGNIPYVPEGSAIRTRIHPIGRDSGQVLDAPVSLYEMTEPLSYREIMRGWPQVLD